jgi:hypothetical protein
VSCLLPRSARAFSPQSIPTLVVPTKEAEGRPFSYRALWFFLEDATSCGVFVCSLGHHLPSAFSLSLSPPSCRNAAVCVPCVQRVVLQWLLRWPWAVHPCWRVTFNKRLPPCTHTARVLYAVLFLWFLSFFLLYKKQKKRVGSLYFS